MQKAVFGAIVFLSMMSTAFGRQVWLAGESFNPDPNEEVTVYVQTDTPLWGMWLFPTVEGDATITSTMNWEDCNDFGWSPGWGCEVDISPDGHSTNFGAIQFAGDANGVVGYFKFIYHGGQVSVSITGDAFDAAWNRVDVSTESIVFGQPQPSASVPAPQNTVAGGATTTTGAIVATGTSSTITSPRYSRSPTGGNSLHFGYSARNTVAAMQWPTAEMVLQGTTACLSQDFSSMYSNSYIVYDANAVLTDNTVWDRDVVLNATVFVEGCLLAIKPGVTIYISPDSGGIIVRNGGALSANGTNEEPVYFLPFPGEVYSCAIEMQTTASPASAISYCYIEGAWSAVWINNCRLEQPLEQITTWDCFIGIYEEGPNLTDIINNELINSREAGAEIYLTHVNDPIDPNLCSSDTHILIEHNTIFGWNNYLGYGQQSGLSLHGATEPNKAGWVLMADNLIGRSLGFAIYMPDGWIACPGKFNHGYFDNMFIDYADWLTDEPWNEFNPQYVTGWPFATYEWPYFLTPDSNFIDAGAMTVEETGYLVGQTTDSSGTPDVNMADIGHHYNFGGYVNAGVNPHRADFNFDLGVDANDLLLFSRQWLATPATQGYDARMEFIDANRIDFRDLATFALNWRKRFAPIPADIAPTFDHDPNNIKGTVNVSIPVQDGVYRAILLLDGKEAAEFESIWEGPHVLLDTRKYANGPHKVKTVYVCEGDRIFITSPIEVTFSNELSFMNRPTGFEVGRDYCVYAISEPNSYVFRLYDVNDTVISEQDCNNGISVHLPASTFKEDSLLFTAEILCNYISSENDILRFASMQTKEGDSAYRYHLPEKFDASNSTKYRDAQILISINGKDEEGNGPAFWHSCLEAARHQRMKIVLLTSELCTWANVSYCIGLPNVKLWYHYGHGDYYVKHDGIVGYRQWIQIGKDKLFSYLCKDVSPGTPYQDLGLENEAMYSIRSLGADAVQKLVWVQFDSCCSARTYEFPDWLGIQRVSQYEWSDRAFIGWRFPIDNGYDYSMFEIQYWESLEGGNTLNEAYTAGVSGDGASAGPNFRVYGVGGDCWQMVHFDHPSIIHY
jgi:hypothetical protein